MLYGYGAIAGFSAYLVVEYPLVADFTQSLDYLKEVNASSGEGGEQLR